MCLGDLQKTVVQSFGSIVPVISGFFSKQNRNSFCIIWCPGFCVVRMKRNIFSQDLQYIIPSTFEFKTICTFLTSDSKILYYRSYFPLKWANDRQVPFHEEFNESTYISPIICSKLSCCNTFNFLFAIKNHSLIFFLTRFKFYKIYTKIRSPFHTMLPVVSEINCIKKYNSRIKSGMFKRSLVLLSVSDDIYEMLGWMIMGSCHGKRSQYYCPGESERVFVV